MFSTVLKHAEDRERSERATATRLSRFRGAMCDADFALLVRDVVSVHDETESRRPIFSWDHLLAQSPA